MVLYILCVLPVYSENIMYKILSTKLARARIIAAVSSVSFQKKLKHLFSLS